MGVLGRATCLRSGGSAVEGGGGEEGCPPANLSISQGESCPGLREVKADGCPAEPIDPVQLPKAGFVDVAARGSAMRCAGPWEAPADPWFLTKGSGGLRWRCQPLSPFSVPGEGQAVLGRACGGHHGPVLFCLASESSRVRQRKDDTINVERQSGAYLQRGPW